MSMPALLLILMFRTQIPWLTVMFDSYSPIFFFLEWFPSFSLYDITHSLFSLCLSDYFLFSIAACFLFTWSLNDKSSSEHSINSLFTWHLPLTSESNSKCLVTAYYVWGTVLGHNKSSSWHLGTGPTLTPRPCYYSIGHRITDKFTLTLSFLHNFI